MIKNLAQILGAVPLGVGLALAIFGGHYGVPVVETMGTYLAIGGGLVVAFAGNLS